MGIGKFGKALKRGARSAWNNRHAFGGVVNGLAQLAGQLSPKAGKFASRVADVTNAANDILDIGSDVARSFRRRW